jgi:hypothetical protein
MAIAKKNENLLSNPKTDKIKNPKKDVNITCPIPVIAATFPIFFKK